MDTKDTNNQKRNDFEVKIKEVLQMIDAFSKISSSIFLNKAYRSEKVKVKSIKKEIDRHNAFINTTPFVIRKFRSHPVKTIVEYFIEEWFDNNDHRVLLGTTDLIKEMEKTDPIKAYGNIVLVKRYTEHLQIEKPKPEQTTTENTTTKYTAKHYVLAYLIECNAKGESFPIGQKKELEKIGNKKMGKGKGNRFYKVFNEIVAKDLNAENNLIEIGGENWRTAVKDLSSEPEIIETYLQSKEL